MKNYDSGISLNFYKPFIFNKGKYFNSRSYVKKIKAALPITENNYKGNLLFAVLKQHRYGNVVVLDEGKEKLYAFARFDVEEIYKPYFLNMSEEDISSNIMKD